VLGFDPAYFLCSTVKWTLLRGSIATVKEGVKKDTGEKVAIKVIDKKDAAFDAESLEQEVNAVHEVKIFAVQRLKYFATDCYDEESQSSELCYIAWRLRRKQQDVPGFRLVRTYLPFFKALCVLSYVPWHRISGGTVMDRIIASDHFSEKARCFLYVSHRSVCFVKYCTGGSVVGR
jgi:serine/threonine protein kinase